MPVKRLRRSRGPRPSKKRSGATSSPCQCACTGKGCKCKGTCETGRHLRAECEVLFFGPWALSTLSPIPYRFYSMDLETRRWNFLRRLMEVGTPGVAHLMIISLEKGTRQRLNLYMFFLVPSTQYSIRKPEVALLCIVLILFTSGMNFGWGAHSMSSMGMSSLTLLCYMIGDLHRRMHTHIWIYNLHWYGHVPNQKGINEYIIYVYMINL